MSNVTINLSTNDVDGSGDAHSYFLINQERVHIHAQVILYTIRQIQELVVIHLYIAYDSNGANSSLATVSIVVKNANLTVDCSENTQLQLT